jgi:N-acyl-D-aspartate/D-glutamate deacylase
MEKDATFAQQVEKDVHHEILARGGAENMFVTEFEPRPAYVGKSLQEIADLRGESLFQTARYLQLEEAARIRSYSMSEEDIEYYLTRDYIAISTDGFGVPGIHPRSFGTYPRVIRKYVMDQKVITLPFFVRKATSLPASILRIEDRGWIKQGYWADIIAFDPETIRDNATFDEMDLHSDGMMYVIVNGEIAIDDGQYTGSLPGQVILRPDSTGSESTTN